MAKNNNLHNAKNAKNDEFYTQYEDIQEELNHAGYLKEFQGKTIYCNCDDPEWSNFWKYFKLRFHDLNLKSLISTHYESDGNSSYMLKFDGKNTIKEELSGNGDFRSEECINLLKEADVVVTNPPFSLFREYVAQLMEYNKKFVIWSNNNSITYKEIFPLLKDNKMWLGYTANKTKIFEVPLHYKYDKELTAKKNDGKHYGKVPAISVFTNIDIDKRHEELYLTARYNPNDYPKYDNYDAINVDKVTEIPKDYYGVMGVPITFLDKHNPNQFEIVGLLQSSTDEQAGIPNLRYYNDFKEMRQDMAFTGASGGKANGNPVLQGKSLKGNFLFNPITNEYVHSVYARILIKRKYKEDGDLNE